MRSLTAATLELVLNLVPSRSSVTHEPATEAFVPLKRDGPWFRRRKRNSRSSGTSGMSTNSVTLRLNMSQALTHLVPPEDQCRLFLPRVHKKHRAWHRRSASSPLSRLRTRTFPFLV